MQKLLPEQYYDTVLLLGKEFTFSLMETEELHIPDHTNYRNAVVVKKIGFSMNYRDRSLLLYADSKCESSFKDGTLHYAPIGSEFVGVVTEAGSSVSSLKVGDRVIPDASYPAKYPFIIGGIPSNFSSQRYEIFHEKTLLRIPDELPDMVAAGFTIGAQTVYSMISKLAIKPGENILITAPSSNTSNFALAALQNIDVNIYLLSSAVNEHRKYDMYRHNAHLYPPFGHGTTFERMAKEIGGFDVVIDPFSDIYMVPLMQHMKMYGRYITCGFLRQAGLDSIMGNTMDQMLKIVPRMITSNVSVIGNCLGTREDLEAAVNDACKGELQILIDRVYTGDQIGSFIDRSFNSNERVGKVIYLYND